MNTITVNGSFEEYCRDCPYIDLVEIASSFELGKIYQCNNFELCEHLMRRLSKLSK